MAAFFATANVVLAQPFRPFPPAPVVETVSPRVTGNPFLRLWRADEYEAGPTNSCVVQHPATALIYVGNDEGVLEFDGARWRLLPLPRGGAVRALAIDVRGRVWIAGENEIARLETDAHGWLQAISVEGVLPAGETGAFSALAGPDAIWFGCERHIVRVGMDGNSSAWATSGRFGNIWWMHDALHTVVSEREVVRLEPDGKIASVLSRDALRVAPIRANPLQVFAARQSGPDQWTLLTALGPVRWNGAARTWRAMRIQPPLFREQEAIAAAFLVDGGMAFTGPRGGILVVSAAGRVQQMIDRMPPVVGPRITHLFEDREGGIWLTAQDRVARLQLRSAFARHENPQGILGAPRQIIRHGGELYLAQSDGISRYFSWPGVFPITGGLRRGVEALALADGRLLMAAGGLVEFSEPESRRWSEEEFTALIGLSGFPGTVLAGGGQGASLYRRDGGEWRRAGRLQNLSHGVASLHEGGDGWIWGSTRDGRVWRTDFRAGPALDAPVKFFGEREGIRAPARGGRISFFNLAKTVVATSAGWTLRHDTAADRFIPETRITLVTTPDKIGAEAVAPGADGSIWLRMGPPDRRILRIIPNGDQRWKTEELPAPMIREMPVNALYHDDKTLWVLAKEQVVSVDLEWKHPPVPALQPRVRRVVSEDGTVLWADGGSGAESLTASAGSGSVRAEFAAFSYVTDHRGRSLVQYRTRLEGLDSGWTPWSAEPWRDFSQLPAGRYRLRLQAAVTPGVAAGETGLGIVVPAPWWIAPWAWAAYLATAALGFSGIVMIRTRALRRRTEELESTVAARTDELRRSNAELARLHRLELDEKIAARLAEEKARLEVLRYQLNPHFLYNALNSVYGLVLTSPKAAADMVLKLADFCRATLNRNESNGSTVAECFERLAMYLSIEKVRWKESLRVEIDLDEPAREIRIQPFLLQPLVENAIKYGGSTSPDELQVRISARLEKSGAAESAALVLEVANTGTWVEPAAARAQGNTGLGIANLRQRLERTMPGKHEFTTDCRDGWVIVRIRLRPET